jgi:hypothetical protein
MTCAVACLFALAWPHAVYAFTEPRTYFDAAPNGGGGGRFFTGSPAEGYGCSACHTGGAAEALQVEGLPSDGYVPGMTYDLRLSWPELAKRQAALRKTQKKPPSMGLVAELVAESGQGAGSVEVASGENAHAGELCVLPEGTQAAQLYTVRPGAATVESGVGCAAEGLGQRCLIAVLSCGARELRVRWTAPAQWQGPIWLSAGLVATDKVSGDPEGDSVTELSQVVLPSASKAEHYEARLRSGCSAGGSSAHEQAFGAYAGLFGLCAWIWTSRRRRTR